MTGLNVAVVGATGAVGTRMLAQLAQSDLVINSVKALASARSAGKQVAFGDSQLTVEETTPDSFTGCDVVFFSAGGGVSQRFAPEAVSRGAIVIDNTSAFRMDPTVPLVVPEVNPEALANHHGIIANPNCSTIQMVTALQPLASRYGLTDVVVSTYQAVSGAGQAAINELAAQNQAVLAGDDVDANVLPVRGDKRHFQQANNLLPQIDVFEEDGYTHEEWKMIHETKKIMAGDMDSDAIAVTATCVRVPVPIGHGETVYFKLTEPADVAGIQAALAAAPGVTLQDDPSSQTYPQPLTAAGKRDVFVGRIRADSDRPGWFHMWNVSDNLLKGAAWNSVQIAETMVAQGLLTPKEG